MSALLTSLEPTVGGPSGGTRRFFGLRGSADGAAVDADEGASAAILKLLQNPEPGARREGWERFVACYSALLLTIAFESHAGYDSGMDRYVFMLDELSRHEYRRLRAFDARSNPRFSAWLAVVARRMCIDHHRRRYGRRLTRPDPRAARARRTRRALADLAGLTNELDRYAADSVAPDDMLARAESRHAVAGVLATLNSRDALLLRLRFQEDRTAKEIAAVLEIRTPFQVYRRLRSVCAALRERLGAAGFDTVRT